MNHGSDKGPTPNNMLLIEKVMKDLTAGSVKG